MDKIKSTILMADLTREVANRTGLKFKDVDVCIRTTFDVIKNCLYNRQAVSILRFGVFYLFKTKTCHKHQIREGKKRWSLSKFVPKIKFFPQFKQQIADIPVELSGGPNAYRN
jgi:nucleoid DNA-binding protein